MINSRITVIASLAICLFGIAGCDNALMSANPNSSSSTTSTSANSVSAPALARMTAQLSAASEVPPTKSAATGTVDASFDKQTMVFNWTIMYSGLTGPATAAHFHGPAAQGENAPPAVPLSGSLNSPINGTATLTVAQAADLLAGKWYLNVHSSANPEGEIRGQIVAKP